MKKKEFYTIWTGLVFLLLFALWTMLLCVIDVQPIGAAETAVGFAGWNGWFHRLTGVHLALYTLTDWLGLIPLFVCLLFGGIGLIQLVRRKSLRKVDDDLKILGIYYCIVIVCYLIFERIPINYRPILIEGRLEPSYPSSTTLLVLSVMPTLLEQTRRRVKNAAVKNSIQIFVIGFSVFMVLGRLVAGVHWFTDIVGGILLSTGLFCIYRGIVLLHKKEER